MSNDRLTLAQIAWLTAYAAGMAGGQLLFKLAAQRLAASGSTGAVGVVGGRLMELAGNAYFYLAFGLYCGLAVLWVWLLTFTPLSRAYPFVALAFAITPLLGGLLFGEPINLRLGLGILAILTGLFLVTS
jgi:drug/metabolite transporter (DMT)-like permease